MIDQVSASTDDLKHLFAQRCRQAAEVDSVCLFDEEKAIDVAPREEELYETFRRFITLATHFSDSVSAYRCTDLGLATNSTQFVIRRYFFGEDLVLCGATGADDPNLVQTLDRIFQNCTGTGQDVPPPEHRRRPDIDLAEPAGTEPLTLEDDVADDESDAVYGYYRGVKYRIS